ncbi:MAG: baseplate J/gp47 family protein [Oscillospiraceae bacterium]
MFEHNTYEALVKSALARVPGGIDKREGSMVFNGVAPSMAELAQLFIGLDFVFKATYLLTAPREYLIKRASDRNMAPKPASPAVFRAECNMAVPVGTRFSCEDVNFVVTARMEGYDTEDAVSHMVTCEKAGALGNGYTGQLIPVEYVNGLTRAELVELLVPGEDDEETEAFRQRVLDSFQSLAFGGNQADYKEKVLAMPGVAAVKVHPVWNRSLRPAALIPGNAVAAWFEASVGTLEPAVAAWLTAVYTAAKDKLLTVGGTVKLVLLAANYTAPTETLIDEVQTAVDPTQNAGEGLGLAPIGHVVHVAGVTPAPVDVTLNLTYAPGWSWEAVQGYAAGALDAYYEELARQWAGSNFLTVRISQIESRILSACSTMITDIGGTKINGKEENLVLDPDSIPVRGAVSG